MFFKAFANFCRKVAIEAKSIFQHLPASHPPTCCTTSCYIEIIPNIVQCVPRKGFGPTDCHAIYPFYLSLCTQSADLNHFRGTHCILDGQFIYAILNLLLILKLSNLLPAGGADDQQTFTLGRSLLQQNKQSLRRN